MNLRIVRITIGLCFLFAVALFLLSCSFTDPQMDEQKLETVLAPYEKTIGRSTQVLLVRERRGLFSSKYSVYGLEKTQGHWRQVSRSTGAAIGRNGFAASGEKREGDGKTPSGMFALKRTFGYEKAAKTKMVYRQVLKEDLWVDDPNAPDYNQWVKQGETAAASYEKMKREDGLYKYGIVIEYNTDPVIKGHGSAIFLHVWKGKGSSTAGCVAVPEEDIVRILEWLDPNAFPLILMGVKN